MKILIDLQTFVFVSAANDFVIFVYSLMFFRIESTARVKFALAKLAVTVNDRQNASYALFTGST